MHQDRKLESGRAEGKLVVGTAAQVGFEISLRRLYCSTALHLQWFLGRSSVLCVPLGWRKGAAGFFCLEPKLVEQGLSVPLQGAALPTCTEPPVPHQEHQVTQIHPKNPPRSKCWLSSTLYHHSVNPSLPPIVFLSLAINPAQFY